MKDGPSLVERLSRDLVIPVRDVEILIKSAPARYKVFQIPRRRGDTPRTIAQPARELKPLQYWLLKHVLRKLKVHEAATGYVRGGGIRVNAQRHIISQFLLKMDFANFFPSIKAKDFVVYMSEQRRKLLTEDDTVRAARLLYWRPRGQSELVLSIGAPTSPALSNILMEGLDVKISDVCKVAGVTYTRYADDMTFSGNEPNTLHEVEAKVRELVEQMASPNLLINEAKTLFVSKKHQRRVTGLVLANDGQVSLGHERKRRIRSMVHHFVRGDLDTRSVLKLHGLIAFVSDVEPSFFNRLIVKYGDRFVYDLKEIHRRSVQDRGE